MKFPDSQVTILYVYITFENTETGFLKADLN